VKNTHFSHEFTDEVGPELMVSRAPTLLAWCPISQYLYFEVCILSHSG